MDSTAAIKQARNTGEQGAGRAIARDTTIEAGKAESGLTLLFAKGWRPAVADVAGIAGESAPDGDLGGFSISHIPQDERPQDEAGSLELLAGGLTFDLTGLAPGPTLAAPLHRHAFGLDGPELPHDLEAIHLAPGARLAEGGGLVPVVRTITAIAARLARIGGVRAVCWNPAGTCIETALFVRIIGTWLTGGVFPALGLTALTFDPDEGVRSTGLAFFIGQELWLEPRPDDTPADTAKLAVGLIHVLIEDGGFHSVGELIAPDGSVLDVEPSRDGRVLRMWPRR